MEGDPGADGGVMVATEQKAERWLCTAAEYHADSANSVSHSELECFARSPRLYQGRYLTGEFPKEESLALDMGTVLHAEILENEKAHVVIPRDVLATNGSRRGAQWDQFEAEHAGKILLKEAEYAPVAHMTEAIKAHEAANRILFGTAGSNEVSVRWICEQTGVLRRARIDRLLGNLICDLKSCRDAGAKAFAKVALDLGYHRQAAYYQDAMQAMTGERMPFVFIAVEKTPPFTCAAYELNDEFLMLGRQDNERLLRQFCACRDSGNWTTESHGKIVSLSCPPWAFDTSWEIDQ